MRIIDILGEGEIEGWADADGGKCIYFNDTPLIAPDGTVNIPGVSWQLRYGTPDQDPVPGYPAAEESHAVNTKVTHSTPVSRYFTSNSANAFRVTLQIPAMYFIDKSTGDVSAAPVLEFYIEVLPAKGASAGDPGWTGSWIRVLHDQIIGGKTMSPYQRSYRIDLPMRGNGANAWTVRFTRVTPDNINASGQADANLANDLYWAYYDLVTDHPMIYPNTAYVALTVDARTFGSSIGTRKYRIKGRKVLVPQNYDPITRTYATSGPGTTGGTWDLVSMKAVWTQNPAFILLDMISHPRYGGRIPSGYLEATKADLYVIAQYADGMVPDGFGGTERRYEVNAVIASKDDAYRVFQTMTSAFRGMSYWGAGQVRITADMPKAPVTLINQANVESGMINYEATSGRTRFNYARVSYRDPTSLYAVTPEAVEGDVDDIARRSLITTDIVAWGCTSRGRAHRMGKWAIYTASKQSETVTFKAGMAHLGLRPGDVFQQLDPATAGLRNAGRLGTGTVTKNSATNLFPNTKLGTPSCPPPDTVTVSTAIAPLFPGCAVFAHNRAAGAADNNTGYRAANVSGFNQVTGTVWVWVPAAFIGAISWQAERSGWSGLGNVDMSLRDQWQKVTLAATRTTGDGYLPMVLRPSASVTQTFYTTGWMATGGAVAADFVPTVGTAVDSSIIYLDALLPSIPTGTGNTLSVMLANGQVDLDVPISQFFTSYDGTKTVVVLSRSLISLPLPAQEWILKTYNLSPKQYLTIAVTEPARGQFAISAIDHDPTKFDAIEADAKFGNFTYSLLPNLLLAALPPPSNIQVTPYLTGVGSTTILRLTVSWTAPGDARIIRYQVRLASASVAKIVDAAGVYIDIDNLPPETYQVSVRSMGANDRVSVWTNAVTATVVDGKAAAPVAPLSLTAMGGTRRVQLSWQAVPRRDIGYYEVWRAPDVSGVVGSWSQLPNATGTSYLDAQSSVLLPNTKWWYKIRAVATTGTIGDFSSAVWGQTTLLIVDDLADGIINTAKFAQTIKAPYIIANSTVAGGAINDLAVNTADNKLYRWDGSTWKAVVNATDLAGQLTDSQISSLTFAKATDKITTTMITDGAISTVKLDAGSVNTAKLAASAVTADKIAANAITADKIAANTITADKIAANTITASQIAADTITAAQIAAGAIGVTELAAGAVKTTSLAADFALASSAQIGTAIIETANIKNLSVDGTKINNNAATAMGHVVNPGIWLNPQDCYFAIISFVAPNANTNMLIHVNFGVLFPGDTGTSGAAGGGYGAGSDAGGF